MPIILPSELKVGQEISLFSRESRDTVMHVGKIRAITNYDMASSYEDLVPRYETMRSQDSTMPPLSELTFFIMDVTQSASDFPSRYVIADAWIEEGSITLIDTSLTKQMTIYNVTSSQMNEALNLLKANGFICTES